MQLASKIPPAPSNKLIRIEQKDAKETHKTPSSESKSSKNFFSRLESNIFMDVLLLLGASEAIPLAKVNRLFRSTIRSLITKTNFKKNFIYSEIQPFKPYTITPEQLLQKYIVLMRDLAKGMQTFPYGSITRWRYSSTQTTREGTREFKFEVPSDFLERIIFFAELGAINACKTFLKEFPSLLDRGAVYHPDEIQTLLNQLIYSSIKSGNKHLLPLFGNSIFDYHSSGNTYLMEAADLGREEIVEFLLSDQRANTPVKTGSGTCKFIDDVNVYGYTALHCAGGSLSIVKLLKKFGANTELRTDDRLTALHLFLSNKNIPLQQKIELFKLLATDLQMLDGEGIRLLYYLIIAGFPLCYIQQCYQANKELSRITRWNWTMSLAAAAPYESSDEHLQVLNFLYDKMPFPCFDAAESEENDDPFSYAIFYNAKPRVIQFFLDKHLAQAFAQDNVPNKLLRGLLQLVHKGDAKSLQHVFNYLNAKSKLIDQIIHKIALDAVLSGNLELVTLLLDLKWRYWETVEFDRSALHCAVSKGHVHILQLFIKRNCTQHKDFIDQRRWVDWCPPGKPPAIGEAAAAGCAEAVDLLIGEAKAAIDYIDERGHTLLHESIREVSTFHHRVHETFIPPEVKLRLFNTLYSLLPSQLRDQIFAKPDIYGFTFPLYVAWRNAPLPIFARLAEEKCDFSQAFRSNLFPQLNGSNCFHLVALRDGVSAEVLHFLAEKIKLPIDVANESGHTPLYYAVACLNTTAVRFFLAKGANALIPINNEIALGWDLINGQQHLQTGLITGNALQIALSWNFFSDGRFNYFDSDGLKKEHLTIIHLLISHLKNIAKNDLHPQQSAAKKALLDAALFVVANAIEEYISIFETLLETIGKESIPVIADALFQHEDFYQYSQFFVILLKHFQNSALPELTEVFYRFCEELFDLNEDDLDEHTTAINICLQSFINASIDIASRNILKLILGFEVNTDFQLFKESIRLTITKLSVLPDKTKAKEILQQAAFTIIENYHPAEYLKMILDTGIKIDLVQSVENSPPKTLLSCVKKLNNEFNFMSAMAYLELIVDKFVAELDLKEIQEMIGFAFMTAEQKANQFDEADLAFFYDTIDQLNKKLCSFAMKTASPASQSFSVISQALTSTKPDAEMSSGEESKQEIHPSPVNLNFQGLGQNPGTSTPASPPHSSGSEMTLSMQLG